MRRAILLPAFAAGALWAQPHVGYVYPAGGQQGTTVEVRLGGQLLNGASKAYISGPGIEIQSIEYYRPPNGKEMQLMREEMQKLSEKRRASFRFVRVGDQNATFTEADRNRLEELRDKLEDWQRRQFVPQLSEKVFLKLVISKDAPIGPRELRVEANQGLTNPMIFCVGELPEVVKKPGRVGPLFNVVNGGVPIIRPTAKPADPPTDITLPAVVNGQMMPAVADQYKFHAAKGQHIVVAAEARELIPYVSDAVPGWFQAAIALRDAKGKQLTAADHFQFHPDPLLEYDIPADGEYIAEIHDSIFRGREDFVYRLTIGELPVITGIFPLGGKTGAKTTVQLTGWNLPSTKLAEDLKGKRVGLYPVSLRKDGATSNAADFAVDLLPETMAKAAVGRKEKAQKLKLPVIVNGRIVRAGDVAFFKFEGAAGQEIVAEVMARRLGSPLDSMLRLTDAAGKELAFNDDFEDKGAALLTHQADSFLSCKLPAKGTYYLELMDAQHKGGPEYGYRLRISQPRPDYQLRVVPSSFNVRSGSTAPFTVYALRRDGFDGPIALSLKDAPPNFVLSGAAIPAGQDHVRVTVTVGRTPGQTPLSLQLTGRATIAGQDVTRMAVPAQDMEQAFAYHHIVAEDAWLVRVIGSGAGTPWRPMPAVSLQAGTTTSFKLATPYRMQSDYRLALNDAPEGLTIQKVTPEGNAVSIIVQVQGDKAKPGMKGNLILEAYRDIPANPSAGVKQGRRQPMGTLPAVPFEIVAAK